MRFKAEVVSSGGKEIWVLLGQGKSKYSRVIVNEIVELAKIKGLHGTSIVFEGGWENSTQELLSLLDILKEYNFKTIISITSSLGEFEYNVGFTCAETIGYGDLEKNMTSKDDRRIYNFIGSMILDNFIPNDYYLKVGKFIPEQPISDKESFGIKLESENQYIIEIKKAENKELN